MNNDRRKRIAAIIERIQNEVTALMGEIQTEIEDLRDEEQEAFDNMPESLQDGDRGQAMQSAIDALEEAVSEVENIDFESIIESLNTASE